MTRLLRLLALVCLLVASDALADDWGRRSGSGWSAARPTASSLTHTRDPWGSPSASQRLQTFSEQRRFEARVRMTESGRDAERRTLEARLRRQGTEAQLESHRRRVAQEDDLDDLRLRSELRRIEWSGEAAHADRWWASLGPHTRQAFLRSGLELRSARRQEERRARLDQLGREIDGRRPTAADELFEAPGSP